MTTTGLTGSGFGDRDLMLIGAVLNAIADRNRAVDVSLNRPTEVRKALGADPASDVVNRTAAEARAGAGVPVTGTHASIAREINRDTHTVCVSSDALDALTKAAQNFNPSAAAKTSSEESAHDDTNRIRRSTAVAMCAPNV